MLGQDYPTFFMELEVQTSGDHTPPMSLNSTDGCAAGTGSSSTKQAIFKDSTARCTNDITHSRSQSARVTKKSRPPPLFTRPLPTITTVSSPFFLPHFPSLPSPEATRPELSWGTDTTAPSYPSFLASSTAASQILEFDVWSPTSDIPTADILAVYDELTDSPAQAGPEARNHPYIPWTTEFRTKYLNRREDRSPRSPSMIIYQPSRPTSRSGAAAPEPPSPEVPRCGSGPWCRLNRRKQRPSGAASTQRRTESTKKTSHRVLKKRRTEKDLTGAFNIGQALHRTTGILSLGTTTMPVMPRGETSLAAAVIQVECSPLAPSFASAGTAQLNDWLDARRRNSSETYDYVMPLDEYERCGSWLHVTCEGAGDVASPTSSIHAIDAHEKAIREQAIHHGWVCGFTGCDMHPRPVCTRSTFTVELELDNNEIIHHGIAH